MQTATADPEPELQPGKGKAETTWHARAVEAGELEKVARRNLPIMTISPYITEGIEQALQATTSNSKVNVNLGISGAALQ